MSYHQLTENERYQICTLKKAGHSNIEIADLLARHPATIGRELKRNIDLRGYRPQQAQRLSGARRKGAHKARKVDDDILAAIACLIRQELSPQQVVDYLAIHRGVSLHHETVYQIIYADKRNGGDLYTYLRVASKPYRKRYGRYDRRGKLKNRVSIDDRPAVVDRRNRIGDWEGDTVIGKGRKSALLTMVERKTLYTVIVRLTGKRADLLAQAAIDGMKHLRNQVKIISGTSASKPISVSIAAQSSFTPWSRHQPMWAIPWFCPICSMERKAAPGETLRTAARGKQTLITSLEPETSPRQRAGAIEN